ncbi:hypothetical protein D3C81_1666340 [compost metagenome]
MNGRENRIANGARPPPNVTTSTKYTMAIAAAMAIPSWPKVSLICSVTPPKETVTPSGRSSASTFSFTLFEALFTSLAIISAVTSTLILPSMRVMESGDVPFSIVATWLIGTVNPSGEASVASSIS